MINLILLVDNKWGITKGGKKIYNLPPHEKKIKELVKGNIVVYGFHHYMNSDMKPIEGCINYVLGPSYLKSVGGIIALHSTSELLKIAEESKSPIYVIGGATTINSLYKYATNIYVTQMEKDLSADVFMVNLDRQTTDFVLVDKSEEFSYRKNKYRFLTYESLLRNRY